MEHKKVYVLRKKAVFAISALRPLTIINLNLLYLSNCAIYKKKNKSQFKNFSR
jgi:hypothetical protein